MPIARGLLGSTFPAKDLRDAVEGLMTGQGWVLALDYVNTQGYRCHIWRNPATNNSWGQDFYVGIGIFDAPATAAQNNQIFWSLTEVFDTVTKFATKFAPVSNTNITTVQSDGTITNPTTSRELLRTDLGAGSNNPYPVTPTQPVVPAAAYGALVTKDAIYAYGGGSGLAATMMVGRMPPRNTHPQENGLMILPGTCGTFNSSIAQSPAFTRVPGSYQIGVSQTQYIWQPNTTNGDSQGGNPWFAEGFVSYQDQMLNNQPRITKMYVAERFRNVLRAEIGGDALRIVLDADIRDDLVVTVNGVSRTYFHLGHQVWLNQNALS